MKRFIQYVTALANPSTWRRAIRQSLRCALTLILPLFLMDSSNAASNDIEVIRGGLLNPPKLEYYLFQYELYSSTLSIQSSEPNPAPQVRRGRWKSGAVNWTQSLGTTNIGVGAGRGNFRGRMGNLFWEAHKGYVTTFDTALNQGMTNHPIYYLGAVAQEDALHLLRLGLPEIDFPNATWDGSTFEGEATLHKLTQWQTNLRVSGRIEQRTPNQFEIAVTNVNTGNLQVKVGLTYDVSLDKNPFPASIERYDDLGSGLTKSVTYRIHEAQVATSDLPDSLFDPRNMSEISRQSYFFYSNNVLYGQVDPFTTNRFERIRTLQELARPSYRRTIFLAILALLMGLPLVGLAVKSMRSRFNKKNRKAML